MTISDKAAAAPRTGEPAWDITKRDEYAQAGIPEYWIVDPLAETITVLQLREQE